MKPSLDKSFSAIVQAAINLKTESTVITENPFEIRFNLDQTC